MRPRIPGQDDEGKIQEIPDGDQLNPNECPEHAWSTSGMSGPNRSIQEIAKADSVRSCTTARASALSNSGILSWISIDDGAWITVPPDCQFSLRLIRVFR